MDRSIRIVVLLLLLLVLVMAVLVSRSSAQLVVAPTSASCATSVDGSVVGTPNPLNPPQASPGFTGTLPAGNYFLFEVWQDGAGHVTLPGPEIQVQLTGAGQITENPPVSGIAATVVQRNIFIGSASGTETLQGSATSTSTYTQSVPLVTGAAPPTINNTVCQIIANDAGWPTGTGYNFTVTTPAGDTLPGYPLQVQLLGPGNTINLAQGLPLYNGVVTYPVPILARPFGHGPQSISGPLSMTDYNITSVGKLGVGTAVPAWGVDVEGTSNAGMVNAQAGFLVNGTPPPATTCLGSTDGIAFDTAIACLTSLPTLFYQTVALNGTAQAQRPTLNFTTYFTATDSASPARTTIAPVTTGTEAKLVTAANAGTSGNCAQWDAAGGVSDALSPCIGNTLHGGSAAGCVSSGSPCNVTVTWNNGGFPTSTYVAVCTGVGPVTGNPQAAWVYTGTQTATTIVVTTDNRGSSNPGGFTTINCVGTTN